MALAKFKTNIVCNYLIKTSAYLIILYLIVGNVNLLLAQTQSSTLTPCSNSYCSGRTAADPNASLCVGGNEPYIEVGYGTNSCNRKGWARYYIGGLPSNLCVTNVELTYNVTNASTNSSFTIEFQEMHVNPTQAGWQTIWEDADDGCEYGSQYIGTSTGYFTTTLGSCIDTDIENAVSGGASYLSIGMESMSSTHDDIGINGYNYSEPELTIEYTTPPSNFNICSPSQPICENNTYTFDICNPSNSVTYSWNCSGSASCSGTGSSKSVSFTNSSQNATISVTASNACSQTASSSTQVLSSNIDPSPSPSICGLNPPYCDGDSETVSVCNPNSSISYSWSCSGSATCPGSGNSTTVNFSGSGNAIIEVTGENNCANSTTTNSSISVNNCPSPVAQCSANPTSGSPSLTVNFDASNSQNGNSYSWDFGDGSSGSGAITQHTYTNTGTYNACVTVSNQSGTDQCCITINVSSNPPVAQCTANPTSGTPSLTVNFDASNSQNATSYSWDFGDGSSGTGATTTHTYTSSGTYNACVTVSNQGGNDQCCVTINVSSNPAPSCNISVNPTSGQPPLSVNFDGSNSQNANSYSWDFGDGNTGSGATTSHTYNNAGTYNACLTVSNNNGSDQCCKVIDVGATGIKELSSINYFKVYPNPNQGQFMLRLQTSLVDKLEVSIYNLVGKVIYSSQLAHVSGEFKKSIDLTTQHSGIYLLELKTEEGKIDKKIVIR